MTEGWRTPQQREMDEILYSSAWSRLRGVTQVMPITGGVNKTHDRLTHSLNESCLDAQNLAGEVSRSLELRITNSQHSSID